MENILEVFDRTLWEKITSNITVLYLDVEEQFLDREFTAYKVRNQFFARDNHKYRLRALKIKVNLFSTFVKSAHTVRNNALICGYTDFDEVCLKTKQLLDDN